MYSNLKNEIIASINSNGNRQITGQILQNTLVDIVNNLDLGALFLGFATPNTNPSSQANGFYFSTSNGEYTNFIGRSNTPITIGSNLEIIYRANVNNTWIWTHEEIPFIYRKPDTGIPASDLSESVQNTLGRVNNSVLFEPQTTKSDSQRTQAAANILNQTSNSETGKLGYKVLQPGSSFYSQITESNTIYEIKDTFDLENTTINIPENCTLKFNGGKLKNGKIKSNNTTISANKKISDILDDVVELGNFTKDVVIPVGNYYDLFNDPNNNLLQDEGFKYGTTYWTVDNPEYSQVEKENVLVDINPDGWDYSIIKTSQSNIIKNNGFYVWGKSNVCQQINLEGRKRYLAVCYAKIDNIYNVFKDIRNVFYSRAGIGFRIIDKTNIDGCYKFDTDFIGNRHETGYTPIIYVFDVEQDCSNVDCYFGQIYDGWKWVLNSPSGEAGVGQKHIWPHEIAEGNILHAGIYDVSELEVGIPNYKKIYTEYKEWVENYTNEKSDIRDTIFSDTHACQTFIEEMNQKAYFFNMFNSKFGYPYGSGDCYDMYNDSKTYITALGPDSIDLNTGISLSGTLFESARTNVYTFNNINNNLIYEISNVYAGTPNYVQVIAFINSYIDPSTNEVVDEFLKNQSLQYSSPVLLGVPWDPYDAERQDNYKIIFDFREPIYLHIPPKCNKIKVICDKRLDNQGDTYYKVVSGQLEETTDPTEIANAVGVITSIDSLPSGAQEGNVYCYVDLLPELKAYSVYELDPTIHTNITGSRLINWNTSDSRTNENIIPRVKNSRSTSFDLCKLEIAAAAFRPIQEIYNRQIGEPEVVEVGFHNRNINMSVSMDRLESNIVNNNYYRLYGKGGSTSAVKEMQGVKDFVVTTTYTENDGVENFTFGAVGEYVASSETYYFKRSDNPDIGKTYVEINSSCGWSGNGWRIDNFNDSTHFIVNVQTDSYMVGYNVKKKLGGVFSDMEPIKTFIGYAYDTFYNNFRKLSNCTAYLYEKPTDGSEVWVSYKINGTNEATFEQIKHISLPSCLKNYKDNKWYGVCIARYNYIEGEAKDKASPVDVEYSRKYKTNQMNYLIDYLLGYYRNEEGYRDPENPDKYFDPSLVDWDTFCIYEAQSDSPLTFFDVDFAKPDTITSSVSEKSGCYKYAYGKNIFKSISPMSATKTLSAIVAFEHMKPTDYICYTVGDITAGSGSSFATNDQITLRDAIFFLLKASDNSIASSICRSVGYRILSSRHCY